MCCSLLTLGAVLAQTDEGKQDEALALYGQALRITRSCTTPIWRTASRSISKATTYVEARRHLTEAIELAKPQSKVAATAYHGDVICLSCGNSQRTSAYCY